MKKLILFFFLIYSQLIVAQNFEIDTLLWSGPSDNRINLVVLGDGYQLGELDKFIIDTEQIINELFQESPYKEYKNFFNVIAIKVPSNQSGASHPGTATDVTEPSHPVSFVDNYFGSTFDGFNIHRLLIANNSFAISNVLSSNFPQYDQVLMLVNSPHYGGSGGQISISSLHTQSSEIAIHELGHSFANLSDEYYPGDVFSRESKNMTQASSEDLVRWKNWVGDNDVGVYQHCCNGNSSSWYKPHENCKMEALGREFCSVCKEGTIESIYSLVSIIDGYSPTNTGSIDSRDSILFEIDLVEPFPNTLDIDWILNRVKLNNSSTKLTLLNTDLENGNNQLLATVTDTTALLRSFETVTTNSTTVSWDINSITTNINNITLSNFKLKVFPMPFSDVLNFSFDNILDRYTLRVNNMNGVQVFTKDYNANQNNSSVNLSHLPEGAYTLNFSFINGPEISKMVVKN